MWFMVYKSRSVLTLTDGRVSYGRWSTFNCTTALHPIKKLIGWRTRHQDRQVLLLFYAEIPDQLRGVPEVEDLDVGYQD